MKTKSIFAQALALFTVISATLTLAAQTETNSKVILQRPQGPCDIYAAAGTACVAAHSTTRALYASYHGPLYQILRQSDGKTLDIGVVEAVASPVPDAGGYADAAAQDAFCANTYCWISKLYDQSPKHNDLSQSPRGGFSGPAMGGFDNLPRADMAPISIMGHKVYGVFIAPGTGLRLNDAKGTAVDDQAEGQYWVINGHHFNSGCCFDYGNAEIDSHDDDNGTMETTYFGNAPWWFHANPPGPWVMTDQENNLVGCVNGDGSNFCKGLPNISWRFVTAMAKGEPHHWTTLAGDSQRGALSVMFDGGRVNATYDPMRKQGAILLGNGGDNSNGSQGTFYEGAMTAAGTFPPNSTDQLVQANVVAAKYSAAPLSITPSVANTNPPGLQTFTPGSSQNATVTFTNSMGAPAVDVELSISVPNEKWTSVVPDSGKTSVKIANAVAAGATVSATFKVTSGPAVFNGDLVAKAHWTNKADGQKLSATAIEKVRNVSPVKINEFSISPGAPANSTDSFIEIYNAGSQSVDLSNWTLTVHPTQQAIFSSVKIPVGTELASHGFYLLGLSNSGLAIPARAGDSIINVRSTTGMAVGDTISIGTGSGAETRKIASLGTAAGNSTTLWQPLPDGPVITLPTGSTNVPVASTAGFVVGEKIALGHGASYPVAANSLEQYEVATVTAIGKSGTQAYLGADAPAGATNVKVTSVSDISVGDKIRFDTDSVGHGIETVTVTHVGTNAVQTNLSSNVKKGATQIRIHRGEGFAVGDKITVGTPANKEIVTVTTVSHGGPNGLILDITPALAEGHVADEWVVSSGTGIDLAAPLKFNHSANLPFSVRGTGISFQPATVFAHSSNEPVQPLGSGITLDSPLSNNHAIHDVVLDEAVKTAGYQGAVKPSQWFGGPELTTNSPSFGNIVNVKEGSLVLREASGIVVDSLNYGSLVDTWAAEGYQETSGMNQGGCFAPVPDAATTSAGRFPDGEDTNSNCSDFLLQAATTLAAPSAVGATNIKVMSVDGFSAGEKIMLDADSNIETAVITTVGTAGATTVNAPVNAGSTVLHVATAAGFRIGQSITIDSDANAETAVVATIWPWNNTSIAVKSPLKLAHAAGTTVSGSGIMLAAPLTRAHAGGAQMKNNAPTPGAPNRYYKQTH